MYLQTEKKNGNIVGSGNGVRKNPQLVAAAERKFGSKMKIPAHLEEAAYGAAEKGAKPPIYMSGNIAGGAEFNKALIREYMPRIKHL